MTDAQNTMTLYEILSIIGPVLTIIIGGLIGYVFKSINASIAKLDARMDKFDDRIGKFDDRFVHLEKEVFFIKGLIEGKNLSK